MARFISAWAGTFISLLIDERLLWVHTIQEPFTFRKSANSQSWRDFFNYIPPEIKLKSLSAVSGPEFPS